MKPPSDPQTALARIVKYGRLIEAEHPEIDRRMKAWTRGGWPATTMGGASGKGGVSDRTAQQATTPDGIRRMSDDYRGHIDRALLELVRAMAIREAIMAPPDRRITPAERGIAKCANPQGCPDDWWATKAGRCEPCYQFRHRTGRDRTGRETAPTT